MYEDEKELPEMTDSGSVLVTALGKLDNRIQRVHEATAELEKKLAPVMKPEQDTKGEDGRPEELSSDVMMSVRRMTMRVQAAEVRIMEIVGRLET